LQYEDRNRPLHETATYSVQAMNIYGFMSNKVDIIFSN